MDISSSQRRTTWQARELHERVTPDRWCVTLSDLKFLKSSVESSIDSGAIKPPANGSDVFSSEDRLYGPSIYTVTEQHIKPVTALAGKMSWALMRNPNGLDCDLFISHAWQEGIFEFMSKVLHSWPRFMRHAWCCMLANPQHLDIAAMLQSPRHSPFAIALEASKVVLAVPNRCCSIYTRLWCAYEAYLAEEQDKIILIARASNRYDICQSMVKMASAAIVGMLLGWAINFGHATVTFNLVFLCIATVAAAWSMGTTRDCHRKWLHLLGEALCWFLIFDWYTVHGQWEKTYAYLHQFTAIQQRLWLLLFAGAFCFLEVDRLNGLAALQESEQLGQGYRGSIVHATCTRQEDDEQIRREIGRRVADVDYAIKVLLEAGMSSPALRSIACKGVSIDQAANPQITLPLLVLVPLNLINVVATLFDIFYLDDDHWERKSMGATSILVRCLILCMLYRKTRDERCFTYLVIQKLSTVYLASLTPRLMVWELSANTTVAATPNGLMPVMSFQLLTYSFCFFFAVLGIRGTASLPGCGLCLLRMIMARSFRACCHVRHGMSCGSAESESDSESWSSSS
ncbi:unnamed protein product [Symbiodinium sp. CCMP2456]|nr:unnamed protein product [Symbiodinium sp. CCMP2456]